MEHRTDEVRGNYDMEAVRNHKEIIALIKRISGQANFIGTPRIYVDMFDGDLVAAVWFNQVVYWDGKTSEPIGFYKTYAEWKKELGLSEFQVRRVANMCQALGLVNITFAKVYGTPKNHYLVIWPKLLQILRNLLKNSEPLETEGSETEGSETQGSEGEETEGSIEGLGTQGSLSIEEITPESEIMKIWESVFNSLKGQKASEKALNIIRMSRPISCEDGVLVVEEPDEEILEWANDRLKKTIENFLVGRLNHSKPEVRFVVRAEVPA